MEPLKTFRQIVIPIDLDGKVTEVRVPLTIELLERFEEVIQSTEETGWGWLRKTKTEKSIMSALKEFCQPYVPGIDLQNVQPNFVALFFSRVREELFSSMEPSETSTTSTEGSAEPMGAETSPDPR